MSSRLNTRALQNGIFAVQAAVWVAVMRPQAHFSGGVCRVLAFLLLVSLLLFVVDRSADVCKVLELRVRTMLLRLLASVHQVEPLWLPDAEDCSVHAPALPSRFQRPPPIHLA
jgi:hypothetical protein